ncbi:MAG TPA: erythromycin esterase family protein [Meiothermus sp.]|jgi:erythromycin esterase-like protein|nr:erythromycin esterase family protein [Meiothermus sp.]
MQVLPSLEGSYERLFHQAAEEGPANFWLDLREESPAVELLEVERLERAIGVIYRPQTERMSHYFEARLPRQFDFVLHFDETQALEPLERSSGWERDELPETYPSGV